MLMTSLLRGSDGRPDRVGLSLAHRIDDPSRRIIHNLHYLTSSHYGGRSLPSSAHAILGLSPGLPGPSAS